MPLPAPVAGSTDKASAMQAVRQALGMRPFVVMSLAYFVCGMQLVFITTHLPTYLDICGMDPMLSAQALGMIGGFNVLGSLFFGWAGGRWNKQLLLGCMYVVRSIVLAAYFMALPTPTATLVFAGIMGFLWMGVAPLLAGSVAEMFGLRWQAMIQGVEFFQPPDGQFCRCLWWWCALRLAGQLRAGLAGGRGSGPGRRRGADHGGPQRLGPAAQNTATGAGLSSAGPMCATGRVV